MAVPNRQNGHMTVTVIMVDSLEDLSWKNKKQKPLFRKINALRGILTTKLQDAEKKQPRERYLSPKKNNMLSSDLVVHAPRDGKFIAELKLKNILGTQEKDVVVKVSGSWLEILFAEREKGNESRNDKQDVIINKKSKQKIFHSPSMKLKTKNPKAVSEELKLRFHGHIRLPDYIQSHTLQFSINFFGNLRIQADIKGAITPLKYFHSKTNTHDKQSVKGEIELNHQQTILGPLFKRPLNILSLPILSTGKYNCMALTSNHHQEVFNPCMSDEVRQKKKKVQKTYSWQLIMGSSDATV